MGLKPTGWNSQAGCQEAGGGDGTDANEGTSKTGYPAGQPQADGGHLLQGTTPLPSLRPGVWD